MDLWIVINNSSGGGSVLLMKTELIILGLVEAEADDGSKTYLSSINPITRDPESPVRSVYKSTVMWAGHDISANILNLFSAPAQGIVSQS